MSLLNQQKNKKKNEKKKTHNAAPGSKFLPKQQVSAFVTKQINKGSQRGS